MPRKRVKSFEDIKKEIDFEAIERAKREEEARRPKTMEDFGFFQDGGNNSLNKNKTKHRVKQYKLQMDFDEDEEDAYENYLLGQADSHKNKQLDKLKKRRSID